MLGLTSIIASTRGCGHHQSAPHKGVETHRWIDVETTEKLLLAGREFKDVPQALQARGLQPLADPKDGLTA